ncbi:MAG: tetratricopeptide repeat protein [Pseudomonadales bacterium]|nr:tetratricopeptide repeat protein [Pseudomonadales bacterium]
MEIDQLYQSAVNLFQQKQLDKARDCLHNILQTDPMHSESNHLLGIIATHLGQHEEARRLVRRALENSPLEPEFFVSYGLILQGLGELNAALAAFERALQLDAANALTQLHMANLCLSMNRLEQALIACMQAIRLQPERVDARNSLGLILINLQRPDEALISFDEGIALKPDIPHLHNSRGIVLGVLGRLVEAEAAYAKALELDPAFAEAHNNRGETQRLLGLAEQAEASYRRALALNPDYASAHSNLLLLLAANAHLSPQQMLQELQQWDRVHGRAGREQGLPAREPAESGQARPSRLRVAYVSPDLFSHPVSYFLEPLLAGHDSARVEVYLYSAGTTHDQVSERLQSLCAHWRQVDRLSNAELAQLIREDRIDILVDLSGHTMNNRLGAFTYRPAPVQVTYLGFFAPTGLQAMDYWITDSVLHPEDTRELAVESIYRLPRCWVAYQPPREGPGVAPCPSTDSRVTFASFSNLSKLTPAVIATWSELLHRLPASKLLIMDQTLGDSGVVQLLLKRFEKHGIHEHRLLLEKGKPRLDYLETYARVDIVLDPFPRTGGTTTADALWMGVPVITLSGQRYVERISTSKLLAMGLPELVADSPADYLEKALALAENPGRRAELRASLRQDLLDSPLGDGKGLAQAMETAFQDMWDKRQSLAAAGFSARDQAQTDWPDREKGSGVSVPHHHIQARRHRNTHLYCLPSFPDIPLVS